MNLPKNFKFEYRTDDEITIYYASVVGDRVFVDWDTNTGKPKEWVRKTVEKLVEEGVWIIVEESDSVNHPNHYQGKTEVIDIIEQATTDLNGFQAYCLGNVIKYVMRHQKKGGIEDLKKARWYLNRVIGGETNE